MHTLSCFHLRQRTILIFILDGLFQTAPAAAASVPAGNNPAKAVAQTQAGDILELAPGVYKTRLYINESPTIEGLTGCSTKIQGGRNSRTIAAHAPNVVLRNLTVIQSGLGLSAMDADVYLGEAAANVLVEDNNILESSVGIHLYDPKNATVRGNKIVGDTKSHMTKRGNDVTIWNASDSQVANNDISQGRDDIFSNTSTNNTYKNDHFSHLRYAMHYMYTNDNETSSNISVGSNIGYVLMFSDRLRIYGNIVVDSRDQGIMLNYVDYPDVASNVTYKTDKRVLVHNASYNNLHGNYFENCNIGIHFTAAIGGTKLTDSSFINNESRVKYVSTRFLDWDEGNHDDYWSDNNSFDLDDDGFGDNTHRPNGITGRIIWHTPVAQLSMNSPAVSIVKWAQSQFPAILPGSVTDGEPLIEPFVNKTMTRYQTMEDRLIRETQSQKSERNSAGNGAISDGGVQPLRRNTHTPS